VNTQVDLTPAAAFNGPQSAQLPSLLLHGSCVLLRGELLTEPLGAVLQLSELLHRHRQRLPELGGCRLGGVHALACLVPQLLARKLLLAHQLARRVGLLIRSVNLPAQHGLLAAAPLDLLQQQGVLGTQLVVPIRRRRRRHRLLGELLPDLVERPRALARRLPVVQLPLLLLLPVLLLLRGELVLRVGERAASGVSSRGKGILLNASGGIKLLLQRGLLAALGVKLLPQLRLRAVRSVEAQQRVAIRVAQRLRTAERVTEPRLQLGARMALGVKHLLQLSISAALGVEQRLQQQVRSRRRCSCARCGKLSCRSGGRSCRNASCAHGRGNAD
jgi:hypothetical protein